jgi:protein-tyrosine phosphatase
VIDLEGVHNFRTLGPYPLRGGRRLRSGRVFRSGALELMTPADEARLAREIGLRTVLDLRHPDEYPAPGITHALADRLHAISIFPESVSQQAIIAELNGLYGTGPTPERYLHYLQVGGDRLARAFTLFGRPEAYPVLVHCTAGKDRTGVLLAMLMDVLGASDEDIAAEYGLSDASIDRLIDYLRATGRPLEGTDAEIRARLSTPPERMAGFMRLLRTTYGSSEDYLRSRGVDEQVFVTVREILAEPA